MITSLKNKSPIRNTPAGLLRRLIVNQRLKVLAPGLILGYDAVGIQGIPANAQLVFFYDMPNTLAAVQARFPNAKQIGITTQGATGPMWRLCDMETGDLTPPEAAQWAANQIGVLPAWDKPTIYCQAANGQAVLEACAAIELKLGAFNDPSAQVWFYEAWWNDVPNLATPPLPWPVLPEPVGHQFVSYYDNYDLNCLLSAWAYLGPPAPSPVPKEIDMLFVRNPGPAAVGAVAKGGICACDGSGAVNMGASWPNIVTAYQVANVPLPVINDPVLLKLYVDIAYRPYPAA